MSSSKGLNGVRVLNGQAEVKDPETGFSKAKTGDV